MERSVYLDGRKTLLIKSVLSSIPLFYLSLFKMLATMAKEIMKLQRNFFWGWGFGRKEDSVGIVEKRL